MTWNGFKFSKLDPQFAKQLYQFGRDVWHEVYGNIRSTKYIDTVIDSWWTEQYFLSQLENENSIIEVVTLDDDIVAMYEIELMGDEAMLWKIYIMQKYRGKGLGRQLINRCIAILPGNIGLLRLEYEKGNDNAAGFYNTVGFTFEKEVHDTLNDEAYTLVYMKMGISSTNQ